MAITKTALTAAGAAELRFEAHTRAQAPLVLCPLFVLIGALPWFASGLDLVRLGASAACFALSLTLIMRYRGRRSVIVVRPATRELTSQGKTRQFASPARVTLDVCHDDTEAPRGCYVASIELESGGSVCLLADPEPDALLRALSRVLEHLPADVDCRWGLPASAKPWAFEPISEDRVPPPGTPGSVLVSERLCPVSLFRIVAMATALTLLDLILLVNSQQARLPSIHPLGVLLPIAMGGFLLWLTWVLGTYRVRLRAGSWIESEVGALGLRTQRRAAPTTRVRGVYVIGSAAADGRHILLDTSAGPIAVWVPQAVAHAKAREVSRAVEQRGRGAVANLGSITSAPHTSPGA